MFLGLGVPEWLTIIGLVGGLLLTFKVMGRASVAYQRAREAREAREAQTNGSELQRELQREEET